VGVGVVAEHQQEELELLEALEVVELEDMLKESFRLQL
jgi:hypothetical protein